MCIKNSLLALPLFCIFAAAAQQPHVSLLDSASAQLFKKILAAEGERSYLATDRSIYHAGERIWFRGFLLGSASQMMSINTKTLIVDLVDEKDSVLNIVLLNAGRGQLQGKIDLPASMHPGFYWLRAYTKFMAEHDQNNIFLQPLYVINSNSQREVVREKRGPVKDSLYLEFFPEGGSVITGTNSTVAVGIFDGDAQPVSLSGVVKDHKDSIVVPFSSDKNGLGKFEFFPKRFSSYKAEVTWHGRLYTFPLPPFNFYAGQISLSNVNQSTWKLRIMLEDSIYKDDLRTYLIGVAGTRVYFASVGKGTYELLVREDKFPRGPVTFYLLDDKLNVLSERSAYSAGKNLVVKASLDKSGYRKREKANLVVTVADAEGHPVPASLSIAVADSSLLRAATTEDLMTTYFACRPPVLANWSLMNVNDLSDDEADLLMLQRKNLNAANSGKSLKTSRPEFEDSFLFIKGRVTAKNGTPLANRIVTLYSRTGNMSFETDTTDADGRFSFPVEEYRDSTNFSIQLSNFSGVIEKENLELDRPNYPRIEPLSLQKRKFILTASMVSAFSRSHPDTMLLDGKKVLNPVTVRGYKRKEADFDESKRVSQSSKIITSDKFAQGAGGIRNAVLGAGGFHLANGFLVTGGLPSLVINAGSEPLVLVDGVQAALTGGTIQTVSPVLSYLEQLDPNEVDFIEVLEGSQGAAYGLRGGNGVILINSKHSGVNSAPTSSMSTSFWARGYQDPTFFASPNYDNSKIRSDKSPDLRSTIFWTGNSITDSEGRIKLSFFTSDIPGNYKIILRGVTARGDLINETISFRNE